MTEGFAANTQILDGLYALGSQDELNGGPATSSVEWLLQVVERHAAAEQDALGEYAFVAEASADPVVALVMRIILDDEVRHHGLLQRMKATRRDALEWTRSPSALPTA